MWKVWIHSSDILEQLYLEEKGEYEDLLLVKQGDKLIVRCGEQYCQIEKNITKAFLKYIIRWEDPSVESWYAYPLGGFVQVGRASDCHLRFRSHIVSNYQFTITGEDGYVLRDPGSTNGTYVNGKRVQTCALKSGDQICFANQEAYIVKDYLILNEKLSGSCKVDPDPLSLWEVQVPDGKEMSLSLPDIQSYEMELPYLHPPIKKGNLFQALGSSMLIQVSGLASTAAVKLISPDHTERAFMMLMTSASMCIAFLIYGLLNREIQWKDKLKEQTANEENYRMYIEGCERELDQKKNAYESSISQILEWYGLLEDASFGSMSHLPLSLCPGQMPRNWISIKTGKSGYQYQKNELYRYLQTVIQHWSSSVLSPSFLTFGQSGRISFGQVPYVFIQWCWLFWNPGRKWIWITMDPVHDAFLTFEGCLEDHVRLLVRNEEDIFRIQRVIDAQKQYVVYYTDETLMKQLHFGADTLFLKGVSHSGYGALENRYDPFRKFSVFQQYCRIRDQKKTTFQSLFGLDPQPFDSVNLEIILGMDEKNQSIRLDLSEYGDGPHGFIAGMTGSGKSELISSLLMQLVLNNDPAHLQYLIIDFKGGAFGQAFYHFSHCAGMLTNLDKDELSRFRKGIHFEVQRRQALLKEFTARYKGVSAHIDAYNERHPTSCISHLLIIVDELAQLKAEAPEFMANLKEIARVGRSLGIHCLLSTQKPLGIIDDQILANSKFKICLSVSSKADSREVLQHDGAYNLTDPGQFILQIQNKETEYMGKSFWLQQSMDNHSNFWMEVDEKENILARNNSAIMQTVNQYYSQKVLDLYPQHSYIIPLFDQSIFQDHRNRLAIVDIPEKNLQSEWDITFGQSAVILCKRGEQIHHLVSVLCSFHRNHPVYTISIPQMICDFSGLTELFSIEEITDCCTLILFVQTLSELIPYLSLLFHKKVRFFCFISQYQSRDVAILHSFSERLCFETDAVDELRTFFELFLPVSTKAAKGKGLVKMQDTVAQILFRETVTDTDPPLRNVFRYKRQEKGFFVGTWEGKKVYWAGKRKLLICYAQKSRRDMIERMIEGWKAYRDFKVTEQLKEPFEICVINMIYGFEQLNGPTYKEMMYDLDVIWVGAGLEDYSFYLKKKASAQYAGKNMLWQQDRTSPFDSGDLI